MRRFAWFFLFFLSLPTSAWASRPNEAACLAQIAGALKESGEIPQPSQDQIDRAGVVEMLRTALTPEDRKIIANWASAVSRMSFANGPSRTALGKVLTDVESHLKEPAGFKCRLRQTSITCAIPGQKAPERTISLEPQWMTFSDLLPWSMKTKLASNPIVIRACTYDPEKTGEVWEPRCSLATVGKSQEEDLDRAYQRFPEMQAYRTVAAKRAAGARDACHGISNLSSMVHSTYSTMAATDSFTPAGGQSLAGGATPLEEP